MDDTNLSKRCTKCNEIKPLTEFHIRSSARDGRKSSCKVCRNSYNRGYRSTKNGRLTTKRYHQLPYVKERKKKRDQRLDVKLSKREIDKKRRLAFPNQFHAQRAVRSAIRKGKIAKPMFCYGCKRYFISRHIHGHHHKGYDPEQWLDVIWLCPMCHKSCESPSSSDST